METEAPTAPSEPSAESTRMEAETYLEQVENEAENARRWKFSSTCNESTESTTYEKQEFPPPEFPPRSTDPETAREYQKLSEEYARDVKQALTDKVASGKTPELAYAEAEREIGEFEEWLDRRPVLYLDSVFDRLRGGAPNATAASLTTKLTRGAHSSVTP